MRNAWRSFCTELTTIVSDLAVMITIVGGSIFYALFYPLPYQAQIASQLPIAVVDHDRSAKSRELIRLVDAAEQVRVIAHPAGVLEAENLVRLRKIAGFVELPANFERSIYRREPVEVGAYGNAAFMLMYSQVATAASGAVQVFSAEIVRERLLAVARPPGLAAALSVPLLVDSHELFNPGGGYATYVVPAVLILILQQTFLIGIGMVGAGRTETGQDTADKPSLIELLGRAAAYLLLYMLILGFFLLVVYQIYDFPRAGRTRDVFWLLLPFFLAVIFLGFTIGQFFSSRETALQTLLLLSVPAIFLAGFAWPSEIMPDALVRLGLLLPSTSGIDGFVRIYQMGASLAEVRTAQLTLWFLAGFYLTLAWAVNRFRSRKVPPEISRWPSG